MITTGYESKEEEKELPSPDTRNWEVKEIHIGTADDGSVYGAVLLDGEVIGSVRFPSREYMLWANRIFRETSDE